MTPDFIFNVRLRIQNMEERIPQFRLVVQVFDSSGNELEQMQKRNGLNMGMHLPAKVNVNYDNIEVAEVYLVNQADAERARKYRIRVWRWEIAAGGEFYGPEFVKDSDLNLSKPNVTMIEGRIPPPRKVSSKSKALK